MKYLLSINEFFQLPKGKNAPESVLKRYEEGCKKDFDSLYTNDDWNKIIQILERDCSEFIGELIDTESILFRGVKRGITEVTKGLGVKKSRQDRYTVDMRQDVSEEFDNLFADKFGVPLRRSGTFATKQPLNATSYSNWSKERGRYFNYLFFPIGDYRYFWNPKIMDLYSDIENEYWYQQFDFAGDDYGDGEYIEDLWWEIYGEPGLKRDQWSWCKGGGKGEYYYKGKPTGYNTIPRIVGLLRDNPEQWEVDPDIFKKEGDGDFVDESGIKKDLTWMPEMTINEFEKIKEKEVLEDSKREMNKIVSGYQEGGIEDISEQEITFVCKEYYLVDDAFLHKMVEYLNQNVSKLSDDSHTKNNWI
jgi:hypothetical protein